MPVQRLVVEALLVLPCAGVAACRSALFDRAVDTAERAEVEAVLDDWHDAASKADGERYFGHMCADAVFLGTDASERWTLAEFRAYAEPRFSRGQGWTYTPRERHVFLAPGVAWFDERLWNEKYGECRGTGVLREEDGRWRIAQYNLAFPVPNELVNGFLELLEKR